MAGHGIVIPTGDRPALEIGGQPTDGIMVKGEEPIALRRKLWSTMSKALERSNDIVVVRRGGGD